MWDEKVGLQFAKDSDMQKITTIFIVAMLLPTLSFGEPQEPFTLQDGVALYNNNCAKCHGKIEKTSVPNRRASRIASAIKTIGPMAKLKHLSALEIIAISKALKSEERAKPNP